MWNQITSTQVTGMPSGSSGKKKKKKICLPKQERQTGHMVLSLGWEDPLEKRMVTHFSILAWEIPWTEASSGLQSMGSQRVGHDLRTEHSPQHPGTGKSKPRSSRTASESHSFANSSLYFVSLVLCGSLGSH